MVLDIAFPGTVVTNNELALYNGKCNRVSLLLGVILQMPLESMPYFKSENDVDRIDNHPKSGSRA